MTSLESQFETEMFSIYRRAKSEAHYTANIFFSMLSDRGGLATAKYLINAKEPSDGYTNLWDRGRLDLTVEATVVENSKWHALFLEGEIEKAQARLAKYNYKPK